MNNNMRIGITCGAFDLLHVGHIVMFEEAKTQCDFLIVAIQIDPSIDRPIRINQYRVLSKDRYKLKL